jgi:hypothetical protein
MSSSSKVNDDDYESRIIPKTHTAEMMEASEA